MDDGVIEVDGGISTNGSLCAVAAAVTTPIAMDDGIEGEVEREGGRHVIELELERGRE